MLVLYPGRKFWNLVCWFLWRKENQRTRRKPFSLGQGENQQETQPTYGARPDLNLWHIGGRQALWLTTMPSLLPVYAWIKHLNCTLHWTPQLPHNRDCDFNLASKHTSRSIPEYWTNIHQILTTFLLHNTNPVYSVSSCLEKRTISTKVSLCSQLHQHC